MNNISGLSAANNSVSYVHGIIGDVAEFEVLGRGETFDVPSLGNPYLAAIEVARVRPEINITYHPQNMSFLTTHLIVQTGNSLTAQALAYYANSADYGILVNAMPSRVEVRCGLNQPLVVRANEVGTNWTTGLQTSATGFTVYASSPILHDKVTSVKVLDGATELRDFTSLWRSFDFTVDYRTVPIYTGVGITPSDVLEGVRGVTGRIEVSVNESAPLLPYVTNASVLNIQIGIMKHPMSATFTFYSSVVRTNTVSVPGVDVQRQRFEWACRTVNWSAKIT